MSTGTNARSLEFKAHIRDPLAHLVLDTLEWKPWTLPAFCAATLIVVLGLAVLVYVVRDGGLDISKFGGYQSVIPGLAINLAMFVFGSRLYVYFSEKSGTLYQDLAGEGVINQAECKSVVVDGEKSIQEVHGKMLWLLAVVVFVLILLAVWFYQYGLDPGRDKMMEYRSTLWFMYMPHIGLGAYMIGMMVARFVITIWGLRKVFATTRVIVQPLHPDKCGGLKHLLNYALSISYLMALFGLAFAVFTYTTSQVWDEGTITTEATKILELPFFWLGAVVYLIVTPAGFFGTLWTAHGPMNEEKSEFLGQLSREFTRKHEKVVTALDCETSNLENEFKHLDRVHELYQKTAAFPVWPFDMRSLSRFGTVFVTPIIISGVIMSLQIYVFE